ncbi:hypothetical protein HDU92_008217 [Lobulomyces angularis]|nr:hypothetical protein HDU92_008217 [Lobulomyces angularis]
MLMRLTFYICIILFFYQLYEKIPVGKQEKISLSEILKNERCKKRTCVKCPLRPTTVPSFRVNAAITILCRNEDLEGIKRSLDSFDRNINENLNYPYIFINNVNFSETFKNGVQNHLLMLREKSLNIPIVEYSLIDEKDWGYPEFIDKKKAENVRKSFKSRFISYGRLESYSGPFFMNKDLLKYDYYWRVEPDVDFYCKIDYDPFSLMKEKKFKYGFNMMVKEEMGTIPTLFKTTMDFLKFNNIKPKSLFKMFMFFRSKPYQDYFNYLDKSGGFFYERWGDAPVHSLAVGAFLDKNEVHHFSDIGYRHDIAENCPIFPPGKDCGLKCNCVQRPNWMLPFGKGIYSSYWNKIYTWYDFVDEEEELHY